MQAKKQHAGGISIHALREEGDEYLNGRFYYHQHFYPRPPRGGRRKNLALRLRRRVFLSTPSARRATRRKRRCSRTSWHFYPRPPRGGRPIPPHGTNCKRRISIHALREEGDSWRGTSLPHLQHFYPRPPRGGRPPPISIAYSSEYFYPRPPRGGRRETYELTNAVKLFLSTPSARRATIAAFRAALPTVLFLSTPSARRATVKEYLG